VELAGRRSGGKHHQVVGRGVLAHHGRREGSPARGGAARRRAGAGGARQRVKPQALTCTMRGVLSVGIITRGPSAAGAAAAPWRRQIGTAAQHSPSPGHASRPRLRRWWPAAAPSDRGPAVAVHSAERAPQLYNKWGGTTTWAPPAPATAVNTCAPELTVQRGCRVSAERELEEHARH
jgi:hypothetical protein